MSEKTFFFRALVVIWQHTNLQVNTGKTEDRCFPRVNAFGREFRNSLQQTQLVTLYLK